MQNLINLFIKLTAKRIHCPCGINLKSNQAAMDHLATHDDVIGCLDLSTDSVIW